MAIVFDAGSTAATSNVSTLSLSHTFASSASIAIVFASYEDAVSSDTLNSITVGGATATIVGSVETKAGTTTLGLGAAIFIAPPSGAQTVEATWAGTPGRRQRLLCLSYAGTTSYQNVTPSTGGTSEATVSVTSTDGGWVVAGFQVNNITAQTTGADVVPRAAATGTENHSFAGDKASSGAATVNWTFASANLWGGIGLALIPSGAVVARGHHVMGWF